MKYRTKIQPITYLTEDITDWLHENVGIEGEDWIVLISWHDSNPKYTEMVFKREVDAMAAKLKFL